MSGEKFIDYLSTKQVCQLLGGVSSSYISKINEELKTLVVGNRKFYLKDETLFEVAKRVNPNDWERQLRHIDSENHQNFNGLLVNDYVAHSDSKWSHISRQRVHELGKYPNIQRIKWGSTWVYNKKDLDRHFNNPLSVDARRRIGK